MLPTDLAGLRKIQPYNHRGRSCILRADRTASLVALDSSSDFLGNTASGAGSMGSSNVFAVSDLAMGSAEGSGSSGQNAASVASTDATAMLPSSAAGLLSGVGNGAFSASFGRVGSGSGRAGVLVNDTIIPLPSVDILFRPPSAPATIVQTGGAASSSGVDSATTTTTTQNSGTASATIDGSTFGTSTAKGTSPTGQAGASSITTATDIPTAAMRVAVTTDVTEVSFNNEEVGAFGENLINTILPNAESNQNTSPFAPKNSTMRIEK
jgi:hypothetical protein